jgi:hypothetical protein
VLTLFVSASPKYVFLILTLGSAILLSSSAAKIEPAKISVMANERIVFGFMKPPLNIIFILSKSKENTVKNKSAAASDLSRRG